MDFADAHTRVWRGPIVRYQFEYIIQRHRCGGGGGSVMISGEIRHYGITYCVTVNGIPNSLSYWEGMVVTEIMPFLNQGQVTIF
jgi:hypothetical protein